MLTVPELPTYEIKIETFCDQEKTCESYVDKVTRKLVVPQYDHKRTRLRIYKNGQLTTHNICILYVHVTPAGTTLNITRSMGDNSCLVVGHDINLKINMLVGAYNLQVGEDVKLTIGTYTVDPGNLKSLLLLCNTDSFIPELTVELAL